MQSIVWSMGYCHIIQCAARYIISFSVWVQIQQKVRVYKRDRPPTIWWYRKRKKKGRRKRHKAMQVLIKLFKSIRYTWVINCIIFFPRVMPRAYNPFTKDKKKGKNKSVLSPGCMYNRGLNVQRYSAQRGQTLSLFLSLCIRRIPRGESSLSIVSYTLPTCAKILTELSKLHFCQWSPLFQRF